MIQIRGIEAFSLFGLGILVGFVIAALVVVFL